MEGLLSKVDKIEVHIEEVFGNGELVTCRGKGTIIAKDESVLLQTK